MIDRRMALLLVAALGLGGYAVWSGDSALMSWFEPNRDSLNAVQPAAKKGELETKATTTQLNPLAELDIAAFDEMLRRPLFNPTRAPAPPPPEPVGEPQQATVEQAPPAAEEPVRPEDFALLGIASKDGMWSVVMRWNPSNEIHRLKTGDEIQGWSLAEITPQKVKLSRNGTMLDISMFQNLAPPPGQASELDGQQSNPEQGQEIDVRKRLQFPSSRLTPVQGQDALQRQNALQGQNAPQPLPQYDTESDSDN
jgi:hypothetical protein